MAAVGAPYPRQDATGADAREGSETMAMDAWDAAEEEALAWLEDRFAGERGRPAPPGLTAAAAGVREGIRRGSWPLDWVARAAGFAGAAPDGRGQVPADDADLLLDLVAALVAPEEPTGLDEAEETALLLLQPADWVTVVAAARAAGAEQALSPETLAVAVAADAADDGTPLRAEERRVVEAALGLVVPVLVVLGVLDADERLSPLGGWVLPRGVARGLGGDLDAP